MSTEITLISIQNITWKTICKSINREH